VGRNMRFKEKAHTFLAGLRGHDHGPGSPSFAFDSVGQQSLSEASRCSWVSIKRKVIVMQGWLWFYWVSRRMWVQVDTACPINLALLE
jgi:hypothetical protein